MTGQYSLSYNMVHWVLLISNFILDKRSIKGKDSLKVDSKRRFSLDFFLSKNKEQSETKKKEIMLQIYETLDTFIPMKKLQWHLNG